MGNYRFRLSDMIPNAWFYKLKDMSSKTKNHTNTQNPNNKKHPPPPPTQQKIPQFSNPRHSYYFTTDPLKAEKLYSSPINPKSTDTQFPPYNLPRKSSKRRRTKISRTTIKSSSPKLSTTSVISAGCRTNLDSTPENSCSPFESSSPDQNLYEFLLPEFGSDPVSVSDPFESLSSWSSSCSCRISSSATDIIIDMDGNNDSLNQKFEKINGFDLIPELELPPILTKPPKFSDMISEIKNRGTEPVQFKTGSLSVKVVKEGRTKSFKEHTMNSSIRKSFSSSSGVKIRSNSPIIGSKKIQSYSRKTAVSSTTTKNSRFSEKKNISDSFAVVKSSFDPQRDFRESMVEMIIENNLRASKDLEELLACYLSLNSNEYHDLIVKVFEQIWFDLTESRL